MGGIQGLWQVQIGQETTAGTASTASSVLRVGPSALADLRGIEIIPEAIGILGGTNRSVTVFLDGGYEMPETPATYEQIKYLLSGGVKNTTTGSADSTGSGKIFAYPMSTNGTNTLQTFTLYGGDNQQAEVMEYCFVNSFALKGAAKSKVTMAAKWQGRQVQNGTFKTGLSVPSVEAIVFQKGKVYLDAVGGTIGTTQLTNTWLGFELNVATGWVPEYTGDGNLYWSYIYFNHEAYKVDGSLTFVHDAAAVTRMSEWRAETPKLLRMQFEGTALTTAGNYSVKTFRADMPIKVLSVDALGSINGNSIRKLNFQSNYDLTAALTQTYTVVDQTSPLP